MRSQLVPRNDRFGCGIAVWVIYPLVIYDTCFLLFFFWIYHLLHLNVTCILAKSHRAPYPLSMNKSTTTFALIHSNVWGLSPVSIMMGIGWFVIYVDDCTRMTWLYLLKHKDEVLSVFKPSMLWSRPSFQANSWFFFLTMVANMLIIASMIISNNTVSFMRPHDVLKLHSKMVLLRKKIGIFSRLPVPCYLKLSTHSPLVGRCGHCRLFNQLPPLQGLRLLVSPTIVGSFGFCSHSPDAPSLSFQLCGICAFT